MSQNQTATALKDVSHEVNLPQCESQKCSNGIETDGERGLLSHEVFAAGSFPCKEVVPHIALSENAKSESHGKHKTSVKNGAFAFFARIARMSKTKDRKEQKARKRRPWHCWRGPPAEEAVESPCAVGQPDDLK